MTNEEIKTVLENHKHYINRDCEHWDNMRANLCDANLFNADLRNADLSNANLRNANLCDANLSDADLSNANLRNAYLCDANLSDADLSNANLRNANLCDANLFNADLSNANLSNADLRNANLRNADLSDADLSNADLSNADLRNANLSNANLRNADLRNADLRNADLSDADLRGAENIPFIPMTCPDIGEFIGWKKAQNKIIKLLILDDSKRSSATGRKCKCDKALVLEIQELDGTKSEIISVSSDWDKSFIYTVNEIVEEKEFCTDRFDECSKGIHFFINRQEAVNY